MKLESEIYEIRDPRFLEVIDVEARLQSILVGFRFTEGPIWHPTEHYLLFSDIIGDTQYGWDPHRGLWVFRRPSHMANGNAFDHQLRVLTCEHATSRVSRTTVEQGHPVHYEILATHYQGKELNSPNDIVVRRDGAIYFTDPTSGRTARYGVEREPELPFRGVYRLDPGTGELTLLADDFSKPNGLCFDQDESRLFVNDTDRMHIRVFRVRGDGSLEGGEVWAETVGEGVGRPDGMKMDAAGHIFCAGPGGIHVFAPDATCLGVIRTPEFAANFCFGDPDRRTLYITASTSIYRLRLRIPGPAPHPSVEGPDR